MSVVTPTPPLPAAATIERAYRRAVLESLIARPLTVSRWLCRDYSIDVTGPAALDLACDCPDAVYRERICKHAICVAFCRLYGLVPVPPLALGGHAHLPDCLDDFLAQLGYARESPAA